MEQKSKLELIIGPMFSGKCLEENTLVPLFSGEIKKINKIAKRKKLSESLKKAFEKYPQQVPSTPQAYEEGLVADFIDPFTGNCYSSHEISEFFSINRFRVKMLDDSVVIVNKNKNRFFLEFEKTEGRQKEDNEKIILLRRD
jgi:hypothetical protein